MPIQMGPSKSGLERFFKPWQIEALNHLRSIHPEGANSRAVYKAVNQKTKISRASIINFLNDSANVSILTYLETTGKGGRHRVYALTHTENGLKTYLVKELISQINNEVHKETRRVIRRLGEIR